MVEIQRVYDENLSVYGAAKIWAQLNDEGIRVARCTVERLMRRMGLSATVAARPGRPPPTATTASTGPPTWSTGTSRRRPRTGCGSRTSPT